MAETLYESLLGAIETVRGTAIAAPTHKINASEGILTPRQTFHNVPTLSGTRAAFTTSNKVYEDTAVEASGALDLRQAPFIANLALGAGTITTPSGATTTRLHTHVPGMSSDPAKSATWWHGDPNVQVWRAAYHMLDNWTVTFSADSEEAVAHSFSTVGQPWEAVSDPTLPTETAMLLAYGIDASLHIDTSSAIGTTAITGRLIGGEARINRVRSFKRHARGAGAVRTFDATGIGRDNAELDLTFELYDTAQTALFVSGAPQKVRLRLNGDLLEGVLYAFWELDIYGNLQDLAFDTYMDTNRTVTFTIRSTNNAYAISAGHDYAVRIQNNSSTV